MVPKSRTFSTAGRPGECRIRRFRLLAEFTQFRGRVNSHIDKMPAVLVRGTFLGPPQALSGELAILFGGHVGLLGKEEPVLQVQSTSGPKVPSQGSITSCEDHSRSGLRKHLGPGVCPVPQFRYRWQIRRGPGADENIRRSQTSGGGRMS